MTNIKTAYITGTLWYLKKYHKKRWKSRLALVTEQFL